MSVKQFTKTRQRNPSSPPPSTSSALKLHRNFPLSTTTVYLLRQPRSHPDAAPFIISATSTTTSTLQFNHPITGKLINLPQDLDLNTFFLDTLAVSYHATSSFDKIWVTQNPNFDDYTLLSLYNGGRLRGYPPGADKWVDVTGAYGGADEFDDLIVFNKRIYVVNSLGKLSVITCINKVITVGKPVINRPAPYSWSNGWRKRLVCDGNVLLLVVKMKEELFRVYKRGGKGGRHWEEIKKFEGDRVLFMSRYCYFFRLACKVFPGKEYRNCVVFSEGAFPKCGNGGWVFNESDDEDYIGVFRLSDRKFGCLGENKEFPKINWSLPSWVLNASSMPCIEPGSQPESVAVKVEDLGSNSRDENDGEMQLDLISQDNEQEEMESDVYSQDQEDGNMQCDPNSQEKGRRRDAL